MKTLTELFESINKEAFGLKSNKDIYSRLLTEEEQEGYLDYISGVQIIDTNLRLTILEGITGKGMKLIRDRIPKLDVNNSKFKIFANSKILFDTRLYAKFGLCLKFIKLRSTLNDILTTPDIYLKANKCREIYNCFLNFGFIINNSFELKNIVDNHLFPNADHLLLLERKYGDILNDEDLTGIKVEKKVKIKNVINKSPNTSYSSSANKSHKTANLSSARSNQSKVMSSNRSVTELIQMNQAEEETQKKKRVDSYNYEYFKFKESQLFKVVDTHNKNLNYINKLNEHACTNKFIKIDQGVENDPNSTFIYSKHRQNHCEQVLDKMRQAYIADKNSYYTYSKDYLTLSFPMIKDNNKVYEEYLANKNVKYA
jgi:hypothetical protein